MNKIEEETKMNLTVNNNHDLWSQNTEERLPVHIEPLNQFSRYESKVPEKEESTERDEIYKQKEGKDIFKR